MADQALIIANCNGSILFDFCCYAGVRFAAHGEACGKLEFQFASLLDSVSNSDMYVGV